MKAVFLPSVGHIFDSVPTLQDVQMQHSLLAAELGVDVSYLDTIFLQESSNVSGIFTQVSDLLIKRGISDIRDLQLAFSQVGFIEELGRIMNISIDSLHLAGNYRELPLFDVSKGSESALTSFAIYTYFVYSDFHRKLESIKLLRSLAHPNLANRGFFMHKFVKLSHICTRLQGWVNGSRQMAAQIIPKMKDDDEVIEAFKIAYGGLPEDVRNEISAVMNQPTIPPSILGEGFHTLSNSNLHREPGVIDAFSRLLCLSHSESFPQFTAGGKKYVSGEKSIFPWVPLLERHIDKIIDPNSALSQVFCYVFQIQGCIFDGSGNIKTEIIKSSYIPEDIKVYLSEVLAPVYALGVNSVLPSHAFTKDVELERQRDDINRRITGILNHSILVPHPEKEIDELKKRAISLSRQIQEISEGVRRRAMTPMLSAREWHTSKKLSLLPSKIKCVQNGKEQPTALNFSGTISSWPNGMTVAIQQKKSGDKNFSSPLQTAKIPDNQGNIVVPHINGFTKGKIAYRITFTVDETGEFELDEKGVPIRQKTVELMSEYIDTTPDVIKKPTSIVRYPTLDDTRLIWHMALEKPEYDIKFYVVGDDYIALQLDTSLVQYLHNPLYLTVIIAPDDVIDIGSDLGEENSQRILAFAQKIRQEKYESQLSEEEINLFLSDSERMNNEFGPIFDVLSRHEFQPITLEDEGIDALNTLDIPGGNISPNSEYNGLSVWEMQYKGIIFRYIVGTNNILAPVQIEKGDGGKLSPGECDGLAPVMNLFAKIIFYYTHADEKWRKHILNEQSDHQKLEKSYFYGLSSGERKRVIRMLPHLARKSRSQQLDFPAEDDMGIVFEESQESLRNISWNELDAAGRQTFYLFRLSSVTFNGFDESQKATEKRKKLRNSPLGRSIIADRIGKTLGLGGKRDPITPTSGKNTSAGHVLKELIVSEKYKIMTPSDQLKHPDFISDFIDLLERDKISVSFVPAIVRPYDKKLHSTAAQ